MLQTFKLFRVGPLHIHNYLPFWFFFFSRIMVKSPTTVHFRDARQFGSVPLPHTQPHISLQLWSRWTDARPVVLVPAGAWLDSAQPSGCPSRPGAGPPLQLPAGPSRRVPEPPPACGQLRRALRTGGDLVGSGVRLSEPPRHAAAARRTRGTEGHHHGSPGTQNPEHATSPQEGVGVSMNKFRRIWLQKKCLNIVNLVRKKTA